MRTQLCLHSGAPLMGMLLASTMLYGCQSERLRADSEERTAANLSRPTAGAPEGRTTTTVDQVKESPRNFYGKEVRVAGKVDEIHGDRAFELEGTGWAFDDNIIVLTRTPVRLAGGALADDDELIVVGTVRQFVVADIERELGWDLTPEIEVELRDRPVLIADSIRKVGDHGRWTAAEGEVAQPIAAIVTIVTAIDPAALAGQNVALERERVQSVMGKGLWIGPNHMSQLFVLPETMPPELEAGDLVQVSGTLREVPKDAAKRWGLPRTMAGVVREETLFVDAATVREVTPETSPPKT